MGRRDEPGVEVGRGGSGRGVGAEKGGEPETGAVKGGGAGLEIDGGAGAETGEAGGGAGAEINTGGAEVRKEGKKGVVLGAEVEVLDEREEKEVEIEGWRQDLGLPLEEDQEVQYLP